MQDPRSQIKKKKEPSTETVTKAEELAMGYLILLTACWMGMAMLYNLVEYEKEQLRKVLKRGCVFQCSIKRVMNRYKKWGEMHIWKMDTKLFLTKIQLEQQQPRRKMRTDSIKGGGPGDDDMQVEPRRQELSAKEIRIVMEHRAEGNGGTQGLPGVIDKGKIVQWVDEEVSGQMQCPMVIANTKEEKTGKEVGHWVLLEHRGKGKVLIWDTLVNPVQEMSEVRRILEEAGMHPEIRSTAKQNKDGWTCGYHMLEWVRQIVERGMEE